MILAITLKLINFCNEGLSVRQRDIEFKLTPTPEFCMGDRSILGTSEMTLNQMGFTPSGPYASLGNTRDSIELNTSSKGSRTAGSTGLHETISISSGP